LDAWLGEHGVEAREKRGAEDAAAIAGGAFEMWWHDQPPHPNVRYPVNVARLMRDGVPPVEMVLDNWLVSGDLHWLYADAEAGKTWLALVLAHEVMKAGGTVAWFDEELGAVEITRRLLALGADPDLVERRFAYFEYPGWGMKKPREQDPEGHAALLAELLPDVQLVVYDTATDALAEAELDENYGIDVTRWVKAYPERARQLGVAQLVLDHTTKESGGKPGKHAVGSRAKRAKAKVQYAMRTAKPYDQGHVGRIEVTLTKNTRGALIAKQRAFECGGDGHGSFVWQELEPDAKELLAQVEEDRLTERIMAVLEEVGPEGLSGSKVWERVGGNKTGLLRRMAELAGSDVFDVSACSGARGATIYSTGSAPE
jgi:hypothetical protein